MPEEVGHRLNWCRLCKTCLTCPRQPRYIFNTKACKCKEYELKHSARLVKKMHSTDFRFRHLNKEERSAMRFLRKDMGRKVPEIEDSLVRANICGTCQQRLARGVKAERELADEVDKDAAVDFRRHRSTAENIRRRKNKRMKSTSTDESAGAESNVVQDTSDESRASTNPVSEAEIAATALAEIRRTVTPTNQASPLIEQPDSRRCSGNLSLNHRPHSFEGHAYSRDSAPPTVGLAVTSAGTGCAQENSVAGYHRRNRISVDCIINNGDDGAHDGADFSYFQSNAPGSTVIVHGRDILPYKWTGHVEDTHMAESLPTDKRPASEYPPLLLAESAPYPILRLHVYDYAEVKLFSETVLGSITLNELCVEKQVNHVSPKKVKGEQLFSFRYRHLSAEDVDILRELRPRFKFPTPPIERNLVRANICSTCQQRLRRARIARHLHKSPEVQQAFANYTASCEEDSDSDQPAAPGLHESHFVGTMALGPQMSAMRSTISLPDACMPHTPVGDQRYASPDEEEQSFDSTNECTDELDITHVESSDLRAELPQVYTVARCLPPPSQQMLPSISQALQGHAVCKAERPIIGPYARHPKQSSPAMNVEFRDAANQVLFREMLSANYPFEEVFYQYFPSAPRNIVFYITGNVAIPRSATLTDVFSQFSVGQIPIVIWAKAPRTSTREDSPEW
ncbi:hypothetical protein GGI07_003613 [Coemansia sp. Benny D115]|nr:hypothetical protein GGI07_003613 [Coemansia sp. Benny D115]